MATFKNSRFIESFSALKKDDIKGDTIGGITSPYSANNKQAVDTAISNAAEQQKDISNGISNLHNRLGYGMRIDSAKHLEDFNTFSDLLTQAFVINNILGADKEVLKKLSDVLTYAYVKKNKGDFRIYSDFNTAKSVTMLVFKTAKSLGLTFLSSGLDDTVKKVLMSVLYKQKESEKQEKSTEKA